MSIETNELTKKYGHQLAVDHISFKINAGEIVGFLGPNGAGKSTTMKMLTAFLAPDSGTATVCGKSITKEKEEVKKQIGYLPELNPLYYDMYIKEYLSFVAGLHQINQKQDRIEEIIAQTGLTPERHKRIGQLSKGYKQRVGLAQALIHNPKVLILDEPTTGLDPNQITEIRQLIRSMAGERTIMLSTHIMQEVEAICDRVIIIDKGKIVADDTVKNLQNLQSGVVVKVKFRDPISKEPLLQLPGVKEVDLLDENKARIQCDSTDILSEQLFKFAVETNNIILEQNTEEYRLEDVFRNLTTKNVGDI